MVQSSYEDVGQVQFTTGDLNALGKHVVLCHQDLEPRNVLVRRKVTEDHHIRENYELVAIIDWEFAGFYPFAYEYGWKDTVLGSSNMSYSWYTLFKEMTADLIPAEECHTKLIKALTIAHASKRRILQRNVGLLVQTKWIERERLELATDGRRGWTRKRNTEPEPFIKQDSGQLEREILRELGYI
jgi:thiamine kinase-like enzyme